jgi:site-specific recombinase XerD
MRQRGDGLTARYLQALVSRLGEAAGIEKRVTPHTLRHTYATRRLNQGFNLREVQALLGHSSVATTQVYTHVSPDELREKIQAADKPEEPAVDPETLALAQALQALPEAQRKVIAAALAKE